MAVRWTAFPLHPETPEDGRTLQDLFAGRGIDMDQMLQHLKQTADQLKLPFGHRTRTYNSRRAQELGKWAEAQGKGDAFHHAVFRAYFEKGLNIGKVEVLKKVATSVGLEGNMAEAVLQQGQYKDAVDMDWQRSVNMGITAVPTFHAQGQVLVGAQPYATLERFLQTTPGDERRPTLGPS